MPADGREDIQLDEFSTLPTSTLRQLKEFCDTGGAVAAHAALAQLALAAGLCVSPVRGTKTLDKYGAWTPEQQVCSVSEAVKSINFNKPLIVLTFYRSFITAADLKPITALFDALRLRGFSVVGLFSPSLKIPDAADWIISQIKYFKPVCIVNATSFSGKGSSGESPLDAGGVPVFQVALSTSKRSAWIEADRGLSPADMAMHVVLPEVDGRIFSGVASFKEAGEKDGNLEFSRVEHQPDNERAVSYTHLTLPTMS